MMDIFFQDPDEVPLPPEDIRIRQLTPTPWGGGERVRVYLEVDPFQQRPSAAISILDRSGEVVAQVDILETVTRKMELNMHLRLPDPRGVYTLRAVLYYQKFPASKEDPQEAAAAIAERMVIDTLETSFEIPSPRPSETL